MKWAVILLNCAWVLWFYSIPGWDWIPKDSWPAHQDCVAAINRKLAEYKQLYGDKVTITGTAVEYDGPRMGHRMEWKCFPDTVDPRGAKR